MEGFSEKQADYRRDQKTAGHHEKAFFLVLQSTIMGVCLNSWSVLM